MYACYIQIHYLKTDSADRGRGGVYMRGVQEDIGVDVILESHPPPSPLPPPLLTLMQKPELEKLGRHFRC
jgi:hypothetical protein